ncbi:copper transporter [Phytoactinopolyspora mesophila]|uniref:copper transporter n=1 Tax=Phytoactinopolyspora mesophila TaxID=2650750 RepID=UPI001391ABB1
MIDFRYHLVSIIAIFFALAAGIVLGAGPLSDTIDDTLTDQTSDLREDNRRLREQLETANEEQAYQEAFVNEITPRLVSDQLEGERVAVIALPGASEDTVEEVSEALERAGAEADLTVSIEPAWTDPDSEPVLDQLATEMVSSGTELGAGNGFDRGAAVLAAALLSRSPENGEADAPARTVDTMVVTAYEEAGMIQLGHDASTTPTMAVAVAGPVSGDDADERLSRLLKLTDELRANSDGVVVGGPPATAQNGLVAALRGADVEDDADEVSTVDVIDLPTGRVAAVFALAEQQRGGSGHYGIVGDTDGALPPVQDSDAEDDDEDPGTDDGSDSDDEDPEDPEDVEDEADEAGNN